MKKILSFLLVLASSFGLTGSVFAQSSETIVYVAEVVDAAEIQSYSKEDNKNNQAVTLAFERKDGNNFKQERIENVEFLFPNLQFKKPLRIGDQVIIETDKDFKPNSPIKFVSVYRQNNLLIWAIILIGLFLLVAGFRANLKYIIIFFVYIVSGIIVLYFYRQTTYITFGLLFVWQVLATFVFGLRIYQKKLPALILSIGVLGSQFLSMFLVLIMNNINIFDLSFFDLFFSTVDDAREVMMYIFAVISTFPISTIFAEQVISESIKFRKEKPEKSRVDLVKHTTSQALKSMNIIFMTFFGFFFAIAISVIALGSGSTIMLEALNNSAMSQILSVGFLIMFNILVFIPLISGFAALLIGGLETHKLITDRNLKQLEL